MPAQSALSRRGFLRQLSLASAALLVSACGATPTSTPQPAPMKAAPTAVAPTAAAPQVSALPIVKQPLTLSYWTNLDSKYATVVKTLGDLPPYQEFEKRTGIHIDFRHPAAGQQNEQFNLLLASGDYPDMIDWTWLTVSGGPSKAMADKVILRLNDLISQYAPALTKRYTNNPSLRKQVATDSAELYLFPFVREQRTWEGPIVRADWLDKLGIKNVTTLDDWHTMLKTFKEKDPNGNAKADELPFTPAGTSAAPLYAFKNDHAFVGAWGITMEYYQDKGVVKYGAAQPEFKDFLKTMVAWYKEGLIDPDFPSTDSKMYDAKVSGNLLGSRVSGTGSGFRKYLDLMKDTNPTFALVGLPYPVLSAGQKAELGQYSFAYTGSGVAITTACKHTKEATQWLDYKYTPEGHLLSNWGIEGKSYTMVNGEPQLTEEVVKFGASVQYCLATVTGPFIQDAKVSSVQLQIYQSVRDAIATWEKPSCDKLMPPVTPTVDEGKQLAKFQTDMNTRVNEALLKVLTGADSVDNWDKVVQQLKQIGLDDAIKIQQAALDRYSKR